MKFGRTLDLAGKLFIVNLLVELLGCPRGALREAFAHREPQKTETGFA
jgi:hypothetical protein